MTQLDLAARSGLSSATIREIQHRNRPPRVPIEQQALYAGLPDDVLRGLRGGFGRDLLKRMNDAVLSEQDFRGLGNPIVAELRQLLTALSALI